MSRVLLGVGGGIAAYKVAALASRLVRAMLERKEGAAIDELVSSLGWQAHTVRAAITGLRKKGYVITSAKSKDGKTVYRASEPIAAADDAA